MPTAAHHPLEVGTAHDAVPVPRRWRPAAPALDLVAAAVATVGMALLAGRESLWGDEGFTVRSMRLSWHALFHQLTVIDINMSLHYLALRVWTSVFGTSAPAARALSIVCVTVAIVLACRLGRTLFGAHTGAVFRWAFALNPFVWVLGLTARPYALLLLWSVLAALALRRAFERATTAAWMQWALVAVLGCYVHMTAALLVIAQIVYCVARRRTVDRPMLAAGAVLAVGSVPTLVWIAPTNTLNWVPEPSPSVAVRFVLEMAGGTVTGAVVLTLAVLAIVRYRRTVPEHLPSLARNTVLTWLLVPLIGIAVLLPYQSLLVQVYATVVAVPLVLLAARAATEAFGSRRLQQLAIGALLVASVAGLALTARRPSFADEDWRVASRALDETVRAGDGVLFPNTFYRIVAEFYGEGAAWQRNGSPVDPELPWQQPTPYDLDRIKRLGLQLDPDTIRASAAGHERIWLVGIGGDEQYDVVRTVLEQARYTSSTVREVEGIRLELMVTGLAGG